MEKENWQKTNVNGKDVMTRLDVDSNSIEVRPMSLYERIVFFLLRKLNKNRY